MAFSVLSTQQVSDLIVSELESSLSQTIPLLPKAFSRVLAKAISGVYVMLWRYGGFIFLQMFVRYASTERTRIGSRIIIPLVEWGRLVGVGDPSPGERAELTTEITVINQTGTLEAGQQLLRSDTGVIYVLTEDVALDAATKNATIRASSDPDGNSGYGSIGNLSAGDTVSFINALPKVSRDTEIVSLDVSGADAESWVAYRERIIQRFQSPPQGGAYADYQQWGEGVAGILNVYPYTGDPGEMDIYVEATVASSGSADGIPTSAQLTAVEEAINYDDDGLPSRRPAGIEVLNVAAITRTGFDVTISDLNPDTTDTRTGVEDALDEYFRTREPFLLGLSPLPRKDRVSSAEVGGVVSSVAAAHGATVSGVVLEPAGGGAAIVLHQLDDGEKAKLNAASWV